MGLNPPRTPAVCAWYDKLAQRGGYQAHVMTPFAELFGRLAF
jgi:hypothetical protein